MTDYEAGYLQALKDVQTSAQQAVNDPRTSLDGKIELLGMVSYLTTLIATMAPRHEDQAEPNAPASLGGIL